MGGFRQYSPDEYIPVVIGGNAGGTNNPPVATTQKPLALAGCGELVGVVAATQLPALACSMVRFKARWNNTGFVYLGGAGVTKADGATDTTTGLMLGPGDDTGWIPISNLNLLYRICDAVADCLTYMALV